MMPLFGVSLDNIGFSYQGRPDYMNATASFCLVARSFNDKSDSWEPLLEPTDGFLRYGIISVSPSYAFVLDLCHGYPYHALV